MAKGLGRSLNRGGRRAAVLRLTQKIVNLALPITDPGAALGFGTVPGMKFPEGNILMHGMMGQFVISSASGTLIDAWTGNIAIGSTATADSTLTTTDIDMAQVTAIGAATLKTSPLLNVFSSGTQGGNIFDNTDKQLVANINMNIADASLSGAASLLINGYIIALITILGDD